MKSWVRARQAEHYTTSKLLQQFRRIGLSVYLFKGGSCAGEADEGVGLDVGDNVLEVLEWGVLIARHLLLVRWQLVPPLLRDQALAVHHPDVLPPHHRLSIE